MQRRSPLCKPRFLRVAKLLRFQSSTLGTGVVGGVAQGRAGCSDRAVSESELGGARRAKMSDVHAGHALQGLMDHKGSWDTLGMHDATTKGARGVPVGS
jgi:hypothetical protein